MKKNSNAQSTCTNANLICKPLCNYIKIYYHNAFQEFTYTGSLQKFCITYLLYQINDTFHFSEERGWKDKHFATNFMKIGGSNP